MKSSSCMSFIRRHISFMKKNEVFTTGDCLVYGKRSNVDNALFQCVRSGLIVRLARGVFTRRSCDIYYPSAIEMAKIKALRFGKELLIHGADVAARFKMQPHGNCEPTFYVDGSTSRFIYRGTVIHLKKACKKRMHMPDDRAGLAIRALWHKGKKYVAQHGIHAVASLWDMRVEKDKIYRAKAWMPAWLGDHFLTSQYMGRFGPDKCVAF